MGIVPTTTMSAMTFYTLDCMREAFDGSYDTPEPRYRSELYGPAASTWILIAGQKTYELCSSEQSGFSSENWESWKKGFGEVAGDSQVEGELRETARAAKDKMNVIQNSRTSTNLVFQHNVDNYQRHQDSLQQAGCLNV
ncbi:hypothetical protein F4779DRAFT_281089 [Xylariaceae sp. FL0662B]|nr:hypothetical protein F4779DRAFT_281089 [Xylariaceae sp. FL0662B]